MKIVREEIFKRPAGQVVKQINFRAGKMNAIIPASLQFCFDVIKKEEPLLAEARLVITETPIVVHCLTCQTDTDLSEPLFVCPQCGGINLKITSGTEMFVDSIDIEETIPPITQ